jgi:hypothetical protein
MRVIPRNKVPKITFCQVHLPKWSENAAELGLDPLDIAELEQRTEAARVAYNTHYAARMAARSARQRLDIAINSMTTLAASMVKQIRAKAQTQGPRIYPLASLPAPDKGSPIGKPGTPSRFTTELQQVGWLVLRWECKNPRGTVGTMYHVHRQLRAADGTWGPREFLGIAGKKEFTDSTLPPGSAAVQYHVRAIRSTAYGEEANHLVNFGASFAVGAPGQMQLAA